MKVWQEFMLGKTYTVTIKCSDCGCVDFYRREDIAKYCVSFLEGFFNCSNCHKQIDYTSDEMKASQYVQTTLF
jgi:hypothetical protein